MPAHRFAVYGAVFILACTFALLCAPPLSAAPTQLDCTTVSCLPFSD